MEKKQQDKLDICQREIGPLIAKIQKICEKHEISFIAAADPGRRTAGRSTLMVGALIHEDVSARMLDAWSHIDPKENSAPPTCEAN